MLGLEGIPGFVMDLAEPCINMVCINLCFVNVEKLKRKQSAPAQIYLLEEKLHGWDWTL